MERIKQALEKARQERQGNAAPVPGSIQRVQTPADISYTQTRTVQASQAHLEDNHIICDALPTSFTDSFKILRTQVLQRLRDNNWNVLAVTSPGHNEGKTVTAINLAVSLAMEVNYTVLLVDANLRAPSVHTKFGINPDKGLSDYLLDEAPLPEVMVHPSNFDNLVMLPGGRPLHNSAEMLNSPKMAHLVEELKSRYPHRIVIFDLPPVLAAADALAFAPYVDAALLVLAEGKTQQQDAQRAVQLLDCTNIIGTVLNKAATKTN